MPRILVLGAGYAGVKAAQTVSGDPEHSLVWIDRNPYHLVVHEVHRHISSESVENIIKIPVDEVKNVDLAEQARDTTNTAEYNPFAEEVPKKGRGVFLEAEVNSLDLMEKHVETSAGVLDYDYLIVAFGQRTSFQDIPGAMEHSVTCKSLEGALRIRESVRNDLEREGRTRVVVAGGGLTGIQAAGEIQRYCRSLGEDLDSFTVTVLEKRSRLLYDSDTELRTEVERLLRRKGIVTHTNCTATRVEDGAVKTEDGSYEFNVLVWAGGLTSRDVTNTSDIEEGPRPAIPVDPDLEVEGLSDCYVAGDAAFLGGKLPQTAWAAKQMGRCAAENVLADASGEDTSALSIENPGTLVSVGKDALGMVNGKLVKGETAKILKKGAAVRHIYDVAGTKRGFESSLTNL
ncbi:MAG: NAD(P)/FAD-dependent oxidoreductase [Halobacteria archaeon]